MDSAGAAKTVGWPPQAIPVEIFDSVANYLSLAESKNLRLVNREFEAKMSDIIFRKQVLVFGPDLVVDGSPSHSLLKQLGGMFRRFALVSQLPEHKLYYAPHDPCQNIVISFWGLYRWPRVHRPPSRFQQLEAVLSDFTPLLSVLSCLTRTNTLIISLDSGLGYLCGPAPPTFRAHSVSPNLELTLNRSWLKDQDRVGRKSEDGSPPRHLLRKMCKEAGFVSENDIQAAIQLLDEGEGKVVNDYDLGASRQPAMSMQEIRGPLVSNPLYILGNKGKRRFFLGRNAAFLTAPQMETIIQADWAHRSLLLSATEALFSHRTFGASLCTLQISRLSSSLVQLLCSPMFWDNLVCIREVFLGILPDWRKVSSIDSLMTYESENVDPILALQPVYDLLQNYIAPRNHIKILHFEWVSGGELASGGAQRNRYILPVPFASTVEHLIAGGERHHSGSGLLFLPHIRVLSLKNAWCHPLAFFKAIQLMNSASLRSLNLETFSLSARTTTIPTRVERTLAQEVVYARLHKPWAPDFFLPSEIPLPPPIPVQPQEICDESNDSDDDGENDDNNQSGSSTVETFLPQAQEVPTNQQAPVLGPMPLGQIQNPPQSERLQDRLTEFPCYSPASNDAIQVPVARTICFKASGRWAEFIDTFSPGPTCADFLGLPIEAGKDPVNKYRGHQLLDMSFKSCGYVSIKDPLFMNQDRLPAYAHENLISMLILPRFGVEVSRRGDTQQLHVLQRPVSDAYLGEIISFLDPDEAITLEQVFGFRQTWYNGVYPDSVIQAFDQERGTSVPHAGSGRFSGEIHASEDTRMRWTPASATGNELAAKMWKIGIE